MLWEALVQGRWSLVDHFDSDGSRFVVAVENAPQVKDPRGLTSLEMTVAEELGRGKTAKEIGYVLGISIAAVNNALSQVRSKLGLRSRAEVAAFFALGGARAHLNRLTLGDARLLVGRYGKFDFSALSDLTEAEREIALLLMQGATNTAIAKRRNTSPHFSQPCPDGHLALHLGCPGGLSGPWPHASRLRRHRKGGFGIVAMRSG